MSKLQVGIFRTTAAKVCPSCNFLQNEKMMEIMLSHTQMHVQQEAIQTNLSASIGKTATDHYNRTNEGLQSGSKQIGHSAPEQWHLHQYLKAGGKLR